MQMKSISVLGLQKSFSKSIIKLLKRFLTFASMQNIDLILTGEIKKKED